MTDSGESLIEKLEKCKADTKRDDGGFEIMRVDDACYIVRKHGDVTIDMFDTCVSRLKSFFSTWYLNPRVKDLGESDLGVVVQEVIRTALTSGKTLSSRKLQSPQSHEEKHHPFAHLFNEDGTVK